VSNLAGVKSLPWPLKNLFWNSTQCRRRVCSVHSSKSMHMSTPKVAPMKTKKPRYISMTEPLWNPPFKQLSKKTFASWEWARDKAQRRKYEAVFETVPRMNSIVSIN